jgi:predicted nucleic acid-binding protein
LTLVDTNVLFDLLTADDAWSGWSLAAMEAASIDGPLLINDVIYAELSARYEAIEPLDDFIRETRLERAPMPRAALFLAGKAYLRYRASGGTRTGVLSDFFIGAHASVLDIPILTRDIRRYRTYFPAVRLISPQIA